MIDILIRHATVVTVDSKRRVLEDGAIAIKADRIVAVGADSEVCAVHGDAAQIIDGRHMTAIPGLIDCHAHAGHGLVRSLGAGDGNVWFNACAEIYARGSV
jgi:5-methylthioadenosine/S-adenosylhomocysteine deaminase